MELDEIDNLIDIILEQIPDYDYFEDSMFKKPKGIKDNILLNATVRLKNNNVILVTGTTSYGYKRFNLSDKGRYIKKIGWKNWIIKQIEENENNNLLKQKQDQIIELDLEQKKFDYKKRWFDTIKDLPSFLKGLIIIAIIIFCIFSYLLGVITSKWF